MHWSTWESTGLSAKLLMFEVNLFLKSYHISVPTNYTVPSWIWTPRHLSHGTPGTCKCRTRPIRVTHREWQHKRAKEEIFPYPVYAAVTVVVNLVEESQNLLCVLWTGMSGWVKWSWIKIAKLSKHVLLRKSTRRKRNNSLNKKPCVLTASLIQRDLAHEHFSCRHWKKWEGGLGLP